MNAKQEKFCLEYLVDLNATQAAIRAGYSERSARTMASVLLTKPNIQERIQGLQKEISQKTQVTIEEVVGTLAKMMRFDPAEIYDETGNLKLIHDMPKDARLSIEDLQVESYTTQDGAVIRTKKIKFAPRLATLEKLMRHLGGYNANKEGVQDPIVLPIDPFLNEPKTDNGPSQNMEP